MSDGKLSYCRVDCGTGEAIPAAVDGDTSSISALRSGVSFVDRTPSSGTAGADRGDCWGAIEQVTGKAGDIVLMHPWCVHSGTFQLNISLSTDRRCSGIMYCVNWC